MGLLRFDVEESRRRQLPTNTRFVRFQQNINLYNRTTTIIARPANLRCYRAIINKLIDERGEVDSSILAAEDRNLYEAIRFPHPLNPTARQLTLAMIARLSAQSVVFEVLVMLLDEELISRSALHDFVDLASVRDIRTPSRILTECFEFGTYLSQCDQELFMFQSYAMPLRWLACMIVRGAKVDLRIIMSTIERKKLLGAFDWNKYWDIIHLYGPFSVNPQASITDREETGYVGMHLPMRVLGRDVLSVVHDAFDNFDELVQNFQDLCGNFFGFSEKDLVPVGRSLEQLDLLRRHNAGEEGLRWEDGYVFEVIN
ncbi:hypothetical protein JMJ35_003942 [Cladonia borealis]|uniref:Uncharacterized protein n=1 Tax=Cladonia borealis TaxID=184061 RepID=A0AA39R595_9LECA|nr:hypothetical protein JMJ35_003942 [Cladonia borealis]